LSKTKPRTIEVEIYDQKYSIVLQTPLDESEVRDLAQEVDIRMREISRAASTADSLKVAVLTALHLSQEFRELKRNSEQNDAVIRAKSHEWAQALEQVLKSGKQV
jgi:cell division protein ZapA (FtsZ GTPase activity inhibitor)